MSNDILLANCEHNIVSVSFTDEFPSSIHAMLRLPNSDIELYLNGDYEWTAHLEGVAKDIALQLIHRDMPVLP